jgi:hypothetical protein
MLLICGVKALILWLHKLDRRLHRLFWLCAANLLRDIHRQAWNARSAAFGLRQRNNSVMATSGVSRIHWRSTGHFI